MRFRTTVMAAGRTATGLPVPAEVVDGLGAGRRPPVHVRIGGHHYRTTIASRGGVYLLSLSAENRAAAGVAAGEEVEVDVELDTDPQEVTVRPTSPPRWTVTMRPGGRSNGCPTATSCGTCSRSRRPRPPRPGAVASRKRSRRSGRGSGST